jgi:hypothetical protein
MEEMQRKEHESWALIQANRFSGFSDDLFGTSIAHYNGIRLTISKAMECTDHTSRHYMSKQQLIEVEMSAMQWAELMTSMNVGSGVPCTIRRHAGKAVEGQKHDSESLRLQNQFGDQVEEKTASIRAAIDEIKQKLAEAKMSQAKQKEIGNALEQFIRLFTDTAPFIHTMFTEACESTVTEAKSMVDAFVTNAIISRGIEGLAEDVQKRLTAVSEKPETFPVSDEQP